MIATAAAGCYLAVAGLVTGAVEHDPFTAPVEVLHYSFDETEELDMVPGLWQPRDWTRRKGPQFPGYVETGIDRDRGYNSGQSLRFAVNGGQAICYSPPAHIDALHSYVFEGYIRTQLLKHDAALLSVSFLNHKRQRVQRFLSRPVTGTHADWVRVRIGPIAPREDVRFVVIGCHLTHGKKMDIRGGVWFDELFLGKLPQLSLVSNFHTHYKQRFAPIEISANVSGLDLDQFFSIAADDQQPIVPSLDEGVIPDALKAEFARHERPLSEQAVTKPVRDGRWLISDEATEYLILLRNDDVLSVYDTRSPYRLRLRLLDSLDRVIAETMFPLEATPPELETPVEGSTARRIPQTWRIAEQEYGFYRVQSTLERDGVVILEKQASFAVIELTDRILRGEFGWSIEKDAGQMSPRDLADVAAQAGINWLKHPVWKSAYARDQEQAAQVAEMFDRLAHRGITPIGVLSDPPAHIRSKFARDWTGISEVFALPRSAWSPWLEPVIARYSSNIQHWQLGGDDDVSFVGMNTLPETLLNVKREFDRIGRNTQIGIRWNWISPLPPRDRMPQSFLSMDDMAPKLSQDDESAPERPMTGPELVERLQKLRGTGYPRWVLIKPLSRTLPPEVRGADLVKRMVAAKFGGAEAIFATNVFHADHGLLQSSGSPTVLFLPWRITALSLQAAEFLGSFDLPGGSTNFAFSRDGEVVLFVWNEDAPVAEEVYLGERGRVVVVDLWGGKQPARVDEATKRQVIQATPIPKIVRGCSEPVARWRLATQFREPRLPSATGRHPNAIVGRNTFSQGVSGRVTIQVPPDWEIEPSSWDIQLGPGEAFSLPMVLTIPANTSLGSAVLAIDFQIDADYVHNFRISRPIEIGLGDVFMYVIDRKLEDGRLEIEQIIVNRTTPEEILNFNCSLFSRGSRRQKKLVTKLGNGKNQKKYYLPGADFLRGEEMWLRAEQVDGRRVLNYRWNVGRYWDLPEEELQELLKELQLEGDKPAAATEPP